MKTAALLLLIITLICILGAGLMYFFGFIMSFDAPGSDKDPKAWMMRFLIFVPVLAGVALLILGLLAYQAGHYKKALVLGSIYPILGVLFVMFLFITSFTATKKYQETRIKEAEEEKLYPRQTFLRVRDIGTDTIIVWPNRIVAYRLHVPDLENTWNGPLGDLDESRKVLKFQYSSDTKLKPEELGEFMDESGRRFTDVYRVE
jgi:hypothetical protein